jgi:hypothetical protein
MVSSRTGEVGNALNAKDDEAPMPGDRQDEP